ncbi:MAG: bifunctional oligoribonuclease/PAP phosphatase NrnA [Clostridia bacterium]|nr:bifunctional oligoribonuclease/PAP phosphatase NrnA [Clostridia bacterium]
MMNNVTLPEIAARLLDAERILLLSHVNPDGDTVGSVTALSRALKLCGKETVCLCETPIPERNLFICGEGTYVTSCQVRESDLVVSVDVASAQMLGRLRETFESRTDIRIDHHGTGEDFATVNYVDPDAAACAEIVYELITLLPCTLCEEIASPLYTALNTDTGGFRFSNTTARTHKIAAALMEAGAAAADICETLYENVTLESLQSNALFLEKYQLYADGKVLFLPITMEDKERYGFTDENIEGYATLSRKIAGVELGMVLRERDRGGYKVSMRSRKTVDSAALCALFGGGGHARAAGATIEADSFDEACKKLIDGVLESIVFEG